MRNRVSSARSEDGVSRRLARLQHWILWWPRIHMREASCTNVSSGTQSRGLNPHLHVGRVTSPLILEVKSVKAGI
jgi:hypothetical protein